MLGGCGMEYYMGIEGVSMRRSVAALSDKKGNIISTAQINKPISLHTTSRDTLMIRITDLIEKVICNADFRPDLQDSVIKKTVICIGLTGVTFPFDRVVDLPNEFNKFEIKPRRLICTGDAEIIFASHAKSMTGSLLLSHMGSTAYIARKNLDGIRYGGWGPIFGDKGSGYSLGRSALSVISEDHDRCSWDKRELWEEVKAWLAAPDPAIPEWVEASIIWKLKMQQAEKNGYDPRTALFTFFNEMAMRGVWHLRTVISGLAIPLMKVWKAGCPEVDSIVRAAANNLCDQYGGACITAHMIPILTPLVVYGGVLVHNEKFSRLLIESLKAKFNINMEIDPLMPGNPQTMRPVCGALLLALGGSTTDKLQMPSSLVIENLLSKQADPQRMGDLKND
jgi:N-acetylglucosamine kinase-like BadF-type ATPase